jgi:putative transposase
MTSPSGLEYGMPYHIYSRGINRENIFFDEQNYHHFMGLFCFHVGPIAETYAYCLLRNHLHFFIRIKTKMEIQKSLADEGLKNAPPIPSPGQCVGNLLNAYAKHINFRYHRTGSLFQHPFSRIPVTTDRYYEYLIKYIHHNPEHHGFVADFREWPFSSYHSRQSPDYERIPGPIYVTQIQNNSHSSRVHPTNIDHSRFRLLIANDFF